tara:strand:- start:123 stop:521 length:399 start_codon:yes stop_codon:yes gene_type:complete
MNLVTMIEMIGVVIISVLLYYFFKLMFSFLFSDKPMQESNVEIKEKTVYRTRPYKRYSYDGGSVKRSHRFYSDDLVFINQIAESRNAYSSDVINGMINYFVENPELINVIIGDFQSDKPRPDVKSLFDHLNN